jgi:predicted transcriptional regulator of viral defense system
LRKKGIEMNFQDFRTTFFNQIVFTSNQAQAWHNGFDKNNFGRWVKKDYIIKLRNGYYTFKEYNTTQNINLYLANRIYRPSYISLHTALAFYGLIPESITQTTCVSTIKTARFSNDFGIFSYKNIKPQLFFDYKQLPFLGDKSLFLASPEKALIDLLYLYPFYNSKAELINLRLDEDLLDSIVDTGKMLSHMDIIKNKALYKRVKLLFDVYNLHF